MPAMPYAMEKGPYFSVIEDYVNGDRGRAVQMLDDLRLGVPIADLGPLDPPIPGSPYSPADLKVHVNRDWFGMQPQTDAAGQVVGWSSQSAFDPVAKPYTGFWEHWYGRAEEIFRETVVRTLEVSLGVDHDAKATARRGARHWHVSLFWNCPHPWYEGWVAWKQHGAGPRDGQVTVLVNTPAHRPRSAGADGARSNGHHDGQLYNSPLRPVPTDPSRFPPYEVDPPSAVGANGMWLVSQAFHREWTPSPNASTGPPGTWRPPTLGRPYESVGGVVTVAVAEADGGVLPDGRRYEPTPVP